MITVRGLESLPWDRGGGGRSGRCRQHATGRAAARAAIPEGEREAPVPLPRAGRLQHDASGHHAAAPGDILTTLVAAAYRAAAREHVNDFMNEL